MVLPKRELGGSVGAELLRLEARQLLLGCLDGGQVRRQHQLAMCIQETHGLLAVVVDECPDAGSDEQGCLARNRLLGCRVRLSRDDHEVGAVGVAVCGAAVGHADVAAWDVDALDRVGREGAGGEDGGDEGGADCVHGNLQ